MFTILKYSTLCMKIFEKFGKTQLHRFRQKTFLSHYPSFQNEKLPFKEIHITFHG